ncbi:Hypothetical protein R9X50_00240200 [Acrodontium crateriforme]|uniref:HIT domain-containing protein n=1 Tax=Acrodontium crateriforme TaxID=150365 RepID=A0AAQ3M2D7_9PEZI|nr:Hypothetical protein R9X50_00240200 [Acrodontium crateriforme]
MPYHSHGATSPYTVAQMASIDDHYPISCAFCNISKAYQPSQPSPIPTSPDPDKVSPQCHLLLSTTHILAFLDIMPIAPGHILLTTRTHYEKLTDLHAASIPSPTGSHWISNRAASTAAETALQIGAWLPRLSTALCKVTGIEDWNIVQNNGARAAQVVPHVHFHLIPRYQEGRRDIGDKAKVNEQMLKSWKMFGRGSREDLDDEEGAELASKLREALADGLALEGDKAIKAKI